MADLKIASSMKRVDKQGFIAKLARKFWRPNRPMWLWHLAYKLEWQQSGDVIFSSDTPIFEHGKIVGYGDVNTPIGIAIDEKTILVSGHLNLGNPKNMPDYYKK